MCTLIIEESFRVVAFTGDLSLFPQLRNGSVPAKKLCLERKTAEARQLGHEAIYTKMLIGECDEIATYQGSANLEAIRKPTNTTCGVYIQRGDMHLVKFDPAKKPKGRRAQKDLHKDRHLRANGSSLTKVTTPTHPIPPYLLALCLHLASIVSSEGLSGRANKPAINHDHNLGACI